MRRSLLVLSAVASLVLLPASWASAVPRNFSFSGTFAQDDDVQLFNFSAEESPDVYIVSYAYGGGIQADGMAWSEGGFDTIFSLFDSSGALIGSNDDGDGFCFAGASEVAGSGGNPDPNTGFLFDACFTSPLETGNYTVALTQFDNFSLGSLSEGFLRAGAGNFTAEAPECTQGSFCDVSGVPIFANRSNVWAVDMLNVAAASVVTEIPEPSTLALFALGLAGLGWLHCRRKIIRHL
jgi:hypothetical protein